MVLVCGSVDLISRRISSMDFERKVEDSGVLAAVPAGRLWRRRPLIKSSKDRWNKESISEGPPAIKLGKTNELKTRSNYMELDEV